MRFFSKIVFICNFCFIIVVVLHFLKMVKQADKVFDGSLTFQPLIGTIAILGYVAAIILNLIFLILCIYWIIKKKINIIPRWMVIVSLILFPVQFYFIFIMP